MPHAFSGIRVSEPRLRPNVYYGYLFMFYVNFTLCVNSQRL